MDVADARVVLEAVLEVRVRMIVVGLVLGGVELDGNKLVFVIGVGMMGGPVSCSRVIETRVSRTRRNTGRGKRRNNKTGYIDTVVGSGRSTYKRQERVEDWVGISSENLVIDKGE